MTIAFTIPDLKVVPGDNQRGSWKKQHFGRTQPQKDAGWAYAAQAVSHKMREIIRLEGATLTFTRIAPPHCKLDKGDNLNASFKAVRDGVCQWLGIDDGDDRLTFEYDQEQGPPKVYGVRIQIDTGE